MGKVAAGPQFVALLRGINVGGNNIIPMKALARTFESMAFQNVRTYIASGNVLFDSARSDVRALERRIEKVVTKAHGYDATVVVRSKSEMERVVRDLPASWKRAAADVRYYVLFLRHEIDSNALLKELAPKSGLEELSYGPGVLYWSAHRNDLGRTAMSKLPSHRIYPYVTIRNVNTTRKIWELMQG